MTPQFHEMVYAVLGIVGATAGALYDLRSHRIPNWITLPAIAFGLLFHLLLGGWGQLLSSAAAAALCLFVFFIFHVAGGMGAGDVKMMTAMGSLFGLSMVGWLLIMTALAGGVMALGVAIYRGRLSSTLGNVGSILVHHGNKGLVPHPELNLGNAQNLRLPYGIAIFAGTVLCLCLRMAHGLRP
jgi:prepilin peptidase CpaA